MAASGAPFAPVYDRTILAASAARTASVTLPKKRRNVRHRGIYLRFDCTAITSTPSNVMKLQGRWHHKDAYVDLLVDAAVTAVGLSELFYYPGAPTTANVSANGYLPPDWQVVVTAANGNSMTYSVVAYLLP